MDQFKISDFSIDDAIDSELADFWSLHQDSKSTRFGNHDKLKIRQAPSCFATKLSKVKFLKHQHKLDKFHDLGIFWQAFE